MSSTPVHRKLRFGPFELSIGERMLRRDNEVLPLGGRALDILIYLADRPGEIIAKQELIDHVWPDVTVEEGSLRVNVAAIRKVGLEYLIDVGGATDWRYLLAVAAVPALLIALWNAKRAYGRLHGRAQERLAHGLQPAG